MLPSSSPTRRTRIRRIVRAVGLAIAFLALTGCERPRATPVGVAERFVVGPRAAGFVVAVPGGGLQRYDAGGLPVAALDAAAARGASVVFEIPSDVEDTAASASIVLIDVLAAETRSVIVRRWRVDGALEPIASIPLAANETARPCVEGTRSDGAIETRFLTIVVAESGAIRRAAQVDVASGAIQPWPDSLFRGEIRFVSASPSGDAVAVSRKLGESHELLVGLRSVAEPITFAAVEPIAPYWLRDVAALLFVREGGSIARVLLPATEPEWLTGGTFTADFARDEVTGRIGDEQRVTVEKMGFDGFAQICELAPFESGGSREKQLTSGSVDHYGSAWSSDHRFLAFRQRERGASGSADVERIVVIDREQNYRATTIATRTVDALAHGIGPHIVPGTYRLYFVAEGQLQVVDLDPGKSPLR